MLDAGLSADSAHHSLCFSTRSQSQLKQPLESSERHHQRPLRPPNRSPVSSPSTVCTWSSSSFRSSSFRATLRSSRGQASSSEVVFNMISPRGVVTGDWINCREEVPSRLSADESTRRTEQHKTCRFLREFNFTGMGRVHQGFRILLLCFLLIQRTFSFYSKGKILTMNTMFFYT